MKQSIDTKALIGFSDLIRQFYTHKSKELQTVGVTLNHCRLLHLLSDHNGINQQEIANIAAVGRSTISESLTEMVKEGYVERQGSKDDRRISKIYLTEKGREKADLIRVYFDEYCNWCMREFEEEEIGQFEHLLKKFRFKS